MSLVTNPPTSFASRYPQQHTAGTTNPHQGNQGVEANNEADKLAGIGTTLAHSYLHVQCVRKDSERIKVGSNDVGNANGEIPDPESSEN